MSRPYLKEQDYLDYLLDYSNNDTEGEDDNE